MYRDRFNTYGARPRDQPSRGSMKTCIKNLRPRQPFEFRGIKPYIKIRIYFRHLAFDLFQKKVETLNGRLPLDDSSDFDDSVCVLIVMTRSII